MLQNLNGIVLLDVSQTAIYGTPNTAAQEGLQTCQAAGRHHGSYCSAS